MTPISPYFVPLYKIPRSALSLLDFIPVYASWAWGPTHLSVVNILHSDFGHIKMSENDEISPHASGTENNYSAVLPAAQFQLHRGNPMWIVSRVN